MYEGNQLGQPGLPAKRQRTGRSLMIPQTLLIYQAKVVWRTASSSLGSQVASLVAPAQVFQPEDGQVATIVMHHPARRGVWSLIRSMAQCIGTLWQSWRFGGRQGLVFSRFREHPWCSEFRIEGKGELGQTWARRKWWRLYLYLHLGVGGGNSNIFLCSPLFGEDEPTLTSICQMGWNHQLDMNGWLFVMKGRIIQSYRSKRVRL